MSSGPARVLFVDDEPLVLSGLRRALGSTYYRVETATSGAEGLAVLEESLTDDPFSVVVSDMMMPEMNGAEFLRQARLLDADAVLLILSGQADLNSTVAAVNSANLFRFLTKPTSSEDLRRSIDDAVRQHQLVTSERDLLERTLFGAVNTLMRILAMSNPATFGRADRVAKLVEATAERLGTGGWELQVAALLSQIGCVAVPETILESVHFGAALSIDDKAVYATHPDVARALVAGIPRLERAADWIGTQPITQPITGTPSAAPAGRGMSGLEAISGESIERTILHAAIALLAAQDSGRAHAEIVSSLSTTYPRPLVLALAAAVGDLHTAGTAREVKVSDLRVGMLLQQDVVTTGRMTLVRSGERLDVALLARLRNFERSPGIVGPVRVLL